MEEKIRNLIADILEVEPEEVTGDAHFIRDLGMDSMMALEILAAIEKEFGLVIPEETLPKFTNLSVTTQIVQDLSSKES